MLVRFFRYVRALLSRRRVEGETDEELQFHVEMATSEYLKAGLSDAEARRAAARDLGGVTQTREQVRALRLTRLDAVWQDAAYATRLMYRQPAFSLTAVATLAIGIGVTTAILAAAWSVLLRPLPVRDEASIVVGYTLRNTTFSQSPLTWPSVEAWRASGVFKDVAAVTSGRGELTDGVAERISIQQVTANFFRVLGVTAIEGRVFSEDDLAATDTPAVISEALWRSRFGGHSDVIGRRLETGQLSVVVIGVAPPRFDRWRGQAQMWVPLERTISARELSVGYSLFTAIARVDGPVRAAAVDQLRMLTAGIEGNRVSGVRILPLREDVSSPRAARLMLVLIVGVVMAWLVVCANLSMLLLARGPARAGELAVRLALGASRGRLVSQLLLETLVLAIPAGAIGIGAAAGATQWLKSTPSLVGVETAGFDPGWPLLLAGLALTLLTSVACGLVPALTAGRATLAKGATGLELTRSSRRWARTLVVAQIAVSLIVLIDASLLAKSAHRIQQVELGFNPDYVLTFQVSLPAANYGSSTVKDGPRFVQAQTELLDRLSALRGVERATFGHGIFAPGTGNLPGTSISLDDGRRFLNGEPKTVAFTPGWNYIGPEYFAVHGVRLTRGREFTAADHAGSTWVIVVNEAAAALYWPNHDPIGRRINFGSRRPPDVFDQPWSEVVGVVPDIRHAGADTPARPYVYRAALQNPRREFEVMLRTSVPPAKIGRASCSERV